MTEAGAKPRPQDVWGTPKLNGRALDRAILLDRECDYPLPLMRFISLHSTKDMSEVIAVIETEIARIAATQNSTPRWAGMVLAEQTAQELGLKPMQKLGPRSGVSLKDIDEMTRKEFDEWIRTLESAGVRVSRSH